MIDIRELRIGNYVMCEDRVCVVEALDNTEKYPYPIEVKSIDGLIDNVFHMEEIHPIEVTGDILEDCGFEKTSQDSFYLYECDDDFSFQIGILSGDLTIEYLSGQYDRYKKLHYLQNFLKYYFVGHDIELEYKPKEKPILEVGDVFYVPFNFECGKPYIGVTMQNNYYKFQGIRNDGMYMANLMIVKNNKLNWGSNNYTFSKEQIKELIK